MSDPFAFNKLPRQQAPAPPTMDWNPNQWAAAPDAQALPAAGSMGTMGAPAPAAWGGYSQQPQQPSVHAQYPQQQQAHHAPGQQQQPQFQQFNPAAFAEMANNPMAQLGMKYGREIVESSLQRYMPGASFMWNSMRYYFHINNSYVKNKIRKVLFPFTSRNFVRILAAEAGMAAGPGSDGGGVGASGEGGSSIAGPAMAGVSPYAAPVHDENAPDLYIPLMSFITFVLINGLLQGTKMKFTPEVLVNVTSQSLVTSILEILCLKAGLYIISAEGTSFLDIVCFSGYKYLGLCINTLVALFGGKTAYYACLCYTGLATAYFMVNTLMPVVRPENFRAAHVAQLPGGGKAATAQKNYFVLAAGALQILLLSWLGPKL